jgi:hypothetical protein
LKKRLSVTAFSSTWATTMSPLRAVVCGRMRRKSRSAVGLDHRIAPNAQDVGIAAGREDVRDGHRLRRVLVGLDRAAGRDLADDRDDPGIARRRLWDQLVRQPEPDRGRWREADRARLGGPALEVALAFEDLEVVVDGGRGSKPDRPAAVRAGRGRKPRARRVAARRCSRGS